MKFCGKIKKKDKTEELRCVRAQGHRGRCDYVWHTTDMFAFYGWRKEQTPKTVDIRRKAL